jgi:transposase
VIELSQKELQRLKVIENAVEGRLTVREAGELLGLSERQVKRLKAKYEPESADWVRHGNLGSRKPWGLSKAVGEQIVELAKRRYAGFNDSHMTEKLVTVEKIEVSRETVRRLLRAAGVQSPQRRRPRKYRSRRERKAQMGMMLLTDASREDWLEGRGSALTLIGYQDDATSRVVAARFQLEYEDTLGYMRVLREVVDKYGIPLSLYRDQHGTFQRNDKHWTTEEQLAGRQTPTQMGRLLEGLGIESIRALSPQAKGRIERLWKTFQDRLRSELRLAGARTLQEANEILQRFISQYNQRFGVEAKQAGSVFRKVDRRLNLDRIFSLKYERTVGRDHVIEFGSRSIQLPASKNGGGYAGQKVELSHQLNGELHVWLGDRHLTQQAIPLEYTPGLAPRRPQPRNKQPRIYVLGGREAVALR